MKKMILLLLCATSAWAVEYAIQVKQKNGSVTKIPIKEINKLVLPLTPTSVSPEVMEKLQTAIKTFSLLQNYPNPFNPSTVIAFTLPRAGQASVAIYDINGRQVRKLVDSHFSAGSHELRWDGLSEAGVPAAAGTYFYRVRCDEQTLTRKMLLIR